MTWTPYRQQPVDVMFCGWLYEHCWHSKRHGTTTTHPIPDSKVRGLTWGPPGADKTQVGPCWPHELAICDSISTGFSRVLFITVIMSILMISCEKFNHMRLYHFTSCGTIMRRMTPSYGKIFRFIGPLCRVNSPHKDRWRGALMFSSICAWTNGWVSNHGAGNLRRNRAHYGITVMDRPDSVQLPWGI